jgi:anion-transporting  ArsA/GET3 family ATPase
MYDGFKQRARHVLALMGEEQTGFVVVTAPERSSLAEAGHFVERLGGADMHLAGVVVNRWRTAPEPELDAEVAKTLRASDQAEDRAVAACLDVAERLRALERRGAGAVAAFRERHDDTPIATVPELPLDVRDRVGIDRVARHLFEG